MPTEAFRKRAATNMLVNADTSRDLFPLLKYWRVLYALKEGPVAGLKAVAARGHCGACGAEIRSALRRGHVEQTDDGYNLTTAGLIELNDKIKQWALTDEQWKAEVERRFCMKTMARELRDSFKKYGASDLVLSQPEIRAALKLADRPD